MPLRSDPPARSMRRRPPAAALAASAALAALAAGACHDTTAPLQTAGAPAELRYATVGFLARYQDVRVAGDTVVLTTRTDTGAGPQVTVSRRVPTADEWRTFWRAVSDAGVRRWPAECGDHGEADGGGFTFSLAGGEGRAAGSHVNAYPTRDGTCTTDYARSGDATRFSAAVFAVATGAPVSRALGG